MKAREGKVTQQGAGISPEFYATLGLDLKTRQGVAYKKVEEMVRKYCPQARTAIDYGCGPGRSSRLLKQIGIQQVVGVDINQGMLAQARMREIPGVSYQLIEKGSLPFRDGEFDLTFSGIVFLEVPKAEEVHKIISEMKRITAKGGTVMILTATKEGYVTDSDSFECLLTAEQKAELKDGDPVPTRIKETRQEFTDYYWSDEFLRTSLQDTGLKTEEVNLPPQTSGEVKSVDKPAYVLYVCKKID